MNKNPILTIIVPSYNIEKYIDDCVPFYDNERFRGKLLVYFIDDGATDLTKEKLAYYINKNPEVFSFFHKENGGHGSVINYGVHNLVFTKYFKIVDGDDWVDPNNLSKLIDYLYMTDDDLVVNDYTNVVGDKKTRVCCLLSNEAKTLFDLKLTIHSVTFKTSVFKENSIFLTEHVFYEDNEYVLYPLPYIKKFSYLSFPVYQYRLGNDGQSVSIGSRLKNVNHIQIIESNVLSYYEKLINTREYYQCGPVYERALSYFFANDYIYLLSQNLSKDKYYISIRLLNKKVDNYPKIKKYMKKHIRLFRILSIIHFRPYYIVKLFFKERFC